MGLEPDDPALLERDGHDPGPCRGGRGRQGRREGTWLVLKALLERTCRLQI